jgi:hypothetical protein
MEGITGDASVFWYCEIWDWMLPLKIKLFVWLLLEKKILTWENLSKRGFEGPSRCVLCGINEENTNHLFVECRFTKDIWFIVLKELRLESRWEGEKIVDCLKTG